MNKSVGKIYEMIANELWDKIDFTTSDGKSINYRALMTTELGDIHLELFGDTAPNHVRNFVCLVTLLAYISAFNSSVSDKRIRGYTTYIYC